MLDFQHFQGFLSLAEKERFELFKNLLDIGCFLNLTKK